MNYCVICQRYVRQDLLQCPTCNAVFDVAQTGATIRLVSPTSSSSVANTSEVAQTGATTRLELPEEKLTCLRCGFIMEKGYTLDGPLDSAKEPEQWIEGIPEPDLIWGNFKTAQRKILPIQTFRCVNCGYLESYANHQPPRE